MLKMELLELLKSVDLDIHYTRGKGANLSFEKNGKTIDVIDFVGGFGSTMLGHNHPLIQQEIVQFLAEDRPINTQGSFRQRSSLLAERLSELAGGDYRCILTNSGAETVEAAMKHAELSRQKKIQKIQRSFIAATELLTQETNVQFSPNAQTLFQSLNLPITNLNDFCDHFKNQIEAILKSSPLFLSLQKGFHGKTTGAVQLTAEKTYRKGFEKLGPQTVFLDMYKPEGLLSVLTEVNLPYFDIQKTDELWIDVAMNWFCPISALFLEPIQGEGGIREIPKHSYATFSNICKKFHFPLIADEIQCGMGRTGSFLASQNYGILPDYVLLSKSLGGGILKIGALLIRKREYVSEFSFIQTSTFAEDELSSCVSLKTLDLLFSDSQMMDLCKIRGNFLIQELNKIKTDFPNLIKEVRGTGLIVGIEFNSFVDSHNPIHQYMDSIERFTLLASAYLLHVHQIRVLPTLQSIRTIRLEPTVLITEEQILHLVGSLRTLCDLLERNANEELLHFLVPEDGYVAKERIQISTTHYVPPKIHSDIPSVAFLSHYYDPEHIQSFHLDGFSLSTCDKLNRKILPAIRPWHMSTAIIPDCFGNQIQVHQIGVGLTSAQMAEAMIRQNTKYIQELIEDAVDVAKELNANVIGLGMYTSILTASGTTIKDPDIFVTSGNHLSAGLACEAVKSLNPRNDHLAIVGAYGNICSLLAEHYSYRFKKITLIGRNLAKLKNLEIKISKNCPVVVLSEDINQVRDADVVICATSSPEPLIYSRHVKPNAILLDLSVPFNVADEILTLRPDVRLIHGGIAVLPEKVSLNMIGLRLPIGHSYACLAETMLLGFTNYSENFSYGDLSLPKMNWILDKFNHHGFKLMLEERCLSPFGKANYKKNSSEVRPTL